MGCGGRGRRQAFLAPDEALSAYGEVVWSWRRGCWRQARGTCPASDGGKQPVHRGDHVISRKAIAQGMSVCSPLTCMLVCAFSYAQMHTRPRVQRAPGIPCSLCSSGGATNLEITRANQAARSPSLVIPREGGGSSSPEASVLKPISRGVLDAPPEPVIRPAKPDRVAGHDGRWR